MAVLQGEGGHLVGEAELGRRWPHGADVGGRHAGFDDGDRPVDVLATDLVGVTLGRRGATHLERAVIAGAVTVVTVQDVEERRIAGADDPIRVDVRMRRTTLTGDGVDPLDILRTEIQQGLGDEADTLILAHTRTQRPVQLLIGGVDHRTGMRQQQDLVGCLDPPRLQEHLLAVDDTQPASLQGGEHRHLDDIDTERLVDQPVLGEDVIHLGGDIISQPGTRRNRPTQRRQPRPRPVGIAMRLAGRPGMGVTMVQPRVVQLMMTSRRTEIPHDRIPTPRNESETDQLVDRPRTDMRRRRITDVGEIETQQSTQRRLVQRLVQPGQPLRTQPVHVDADFPIDTVRSETYESPRRRPQTSAAAVDGLEEPPVVDTSLLRMVTPSARAVRIGLSTAAAKGAVGLIALKQVRAIECKITPSCTAARGDSRRGSTSSLPQAHGREALQSIAAIVAPSVSACQPSAVTHAESVRQ